MNLTRYEQYEIERLKLDKFLERRKRAFHRLAKTVLRTFGGAYREAAKLVGAASLYGSEYTKELIDWLRENGVDTSDEQGLRRIFMDLWGPYVISDYLTTSKRRRNL